jgi:hypothetical protein
VTVFADPYFYGGYWPGWAGGIPSPLPVPAPAGADKPPEFDKALVRKETWGGSAGGRQTPYSKAPAGTYGTYGLMARNPTIAKAYGIIMHAILAGSWNVKIRTEAGEARTYKPSLIGQVGDGVISSPEDAWAETLLQTFDPMRSYMLSAAGRGLFNGHSPLHTEWARYNGATVVSRLRRFTDAQHPDAAKFTAFDIDTVDLGDVAPAQGAILDKLRYLDAELLAGFYLAPLQAAESIHGTRAQAGVHADANILYSELVYRGIIEQFNHSLVRLMTLTNRGPAEAERYYFEAGALSDPKQEYLQKLVLALAATPGDPIAGPIDRPKLLADTGAPVDVNFKPQPALPPGPTPPEGGPGGGNGNGQANGNGRANGVPAGGGRMALSTGGWPDGGGPFDEEGDYALVLNCGTGAGGFVAGNVCAKGGRLFEVTKVTRAGMVHGRGADESPDMPSVELGHVSEFTAAGSLADAPLPEFAAKVQALADGLPVGFGDNKVLIADAFKAAHAADPALTPAVFKARLKAANNAGHIELSRADLTSRFHQDDLRASSINLAPGRAADAPDEVGGGGNTAEFIVVPSRARRQVRGGK